MATASQWPGRLLGDGSTRHGLNGRLFPLRRRTRAFHNSGRKRSSKYAIENDEALPPYLRKKGATTSGIFIKDTSVPGRPPKHIDFNLIRDLCKCEYCVDPQTGQKKHHISQPSISTKPRVQGDFDNGKVTFDWGQKPDGSNDEGSHKTTATLEDLYFHESNYRRKYLGPNHPKPILWKRDTLKAHSESLGTKRFADFLYNDSALGEVLHGLYSYGIVFIQGVPHDEKAVEKIAERIGPLKNTFYGRTWDVRSKADAENVAYTSQRLDMHMDLLYMREPPGLQLLHCLEKSDQGGATLFADGFQAISEITATDPTAADTLAGYPVPYKFETQTGDIYFDAKPLVEFDLAHLHDRRNRTTAPGVRNDAFPMDSVKAVNWSPPFQAPFMNHARPGEVGTELAEYKRVAASFNSHVNDPENVFPRVLNPGECVIFNNRRIVHGRTAFQGGVDRWLKGAYLDMDDFEARLRARRMRRTLIDVRSSEARERRFLPSNLEEDDGEAASELEKVEEKLGDD